MRRSAPTLQSNTTTTKAAAPRRGSGSTWTRRRATFLPDPVVGAGTRSGGAAARAMSKLAYAPALDLVRPIFCHDRAADLLLRLNKEFMEVLMGGGRCGPVPAQPHGSFRRRVGGGPLGVADGQRRRRIDIPDLRGWRATSSSRITVLQEWGTKETYFRRYTKRSAFASML
jgi:hypothetical protein